MIQSFKLGSKEFSYQYVQSGRVRLCVICHKVITNINRMDHVKCYEKKQKKLKKVFDIPNYIKKRKDNNYEGYLRELEEIDSKKQYYTQKYIEERIKFLSSKINEYQL